MSQLPPKIPTCMQPTNSGYADAAPATKENPSWVDEFLDFSSAKRMTHRRSVSDSVTFMDAFSDENNEFDRFYNDEQLINMFTYDNHNVSLHVDNPSIPSTSSDNNSIDGDKGSEKRQRQEQQRLEDVVKKESEEDQSECTTAETQAPQNITERLSPGGRQLDPKRVKRILANRQSAQRSRVRKLHYISELERSVTTLQAEVSMLSPRVGFLDHQRLLLNVDNSTLKQRIAALAQDKVFKDATHEALTREIERLREVLHHQENIQKMEDAAEPSPRSSDVKASNESQQQLLNV